MKKLLVDYHFHPNLSKHDKRARAKCQLIWQQFTITRLDVTIVTEHVFKNPQRAFNLLRATRPAKATTLIFPGIEALTTEGIDLIVFAADERIYTHQPLMVPKQLSLQAMIQYINQQPDLYGSIAHPFSIGHSGLANRLGKAQTLAAIQSLGGVEVSNTCFQGSLHLFDYLHLSQFIPRRKRLMQWVQTLPTEYYQLAEVRLYTGGSDAHTTIEIGSGLLVPYDSVISNNIFQAITHNQSTESVNRLPKIYVWQAAYKFYTIVSEMCIKAFRLYEGKIYQHDDRFSNFYSEAEKETVLAIRRQRVVLLKPLLNFLTYLGFRSIGINGLGIIALITSAIALTTNHYQFAMGSFIGYILTGGLAGALARYQKAESESGAMMKIALHYFSLTVLVLTALGLEWLSGFWGALYLVLYALMLGLIIKLNRIGQPIHFVIRSRYIMIAAIFIFAVWQIDLMTLIAMITSVYMLVANVWMLRRCRWAILDSNQ